MFEKIIKLYKSNQYSEVLRYAYSNDNRVKEIVGLSALKLGKNSLASRIFKRLQEENNTAVNNYHFALASMNLQNFKKAKIHFNRSKKDGQFEIASKINISHCYIKTKENDRAIELLKKLSIDHPKIKEAWYMLLLEYRSSKEIEGLIKTLDNSKAYIGQSHQWKKSYCYQLYFEEQYNKVINYITDNFDSSINSINIILAKSYSKISNFEKAVNIYISILDDKATALNYYNVAATLSNLTNKKDLNKSLIYASNCLELDNNYHQANYCKSLVFQKLGQITQSIIKINLALQLDENNLEYLYTKAELHNYIKENNKSLELIEKILFLDKSFFKAIRLKGIIELQLNKIIESEETLLKALNINNTDQRTLAYYSISKIVQNKYTDSNQYFGVESFVKEYYLNPKEEYKSLHEFNYELSKDIRNHSKLRKNPYGLAARNGYLTEDVFKDNTKAIILFKKLLIENISKYIGELKINTHHHFLRHKTSKYKISSWATLVQGDGFIDKHIHEDSWLSGAYYCCVPNITNNTKQNEGYFEYGCIPEDLTLPINKPRGFIKPLEGKIILFPSYLYHQTIPHNTLDDRISIAFDLTPISWKK